MSRSLAALIAAPIRFPNAEAEYIRVLARGLARAGHRVTVLGRSGSPLLAWAREDGLPVEERFRLDSLSPAAWFRLRFALPRFLAAGGFDVVNVHRSEGFIWMAEAVRRLPRPPALVRTRGDMRPVRRDPLNRRLYGRADAVIASNDLLREELMLRLGLSRERVQTVHYGLDPAERQPRRSPDEVRRELGLRPEARLVGMVGRIGPVKGHRYLLEAAPEILRAVPEAEFLVLYPMIENGSDFLDRLSRSGLQKKFHLLGPRPDLPDLMQLAELGVIPSVGSEANCRVALEWMALKKPLVASRVGAIPELVVPAETGFLHLPRLSGVLAKAVIALLQDPPRLRRMGEAGRKLLDERFSAERMVGLTERIFIQAVENKGKK